jgi:hypothetical protein
MREARPLLTTGRTSTPPTVHSHRIAVETPHEAVQVTLGPERKATPTKHRPVPGGFSKLFNRVIDTGQWAALPDAGRAVYIPMVRLADPHGGGFRARVGLASLMKHSGLSRSSVKRGLKAIQEAGLVAIVRRGGVSAEGQNHTNIYELLVPDDQADLPTVDSPSRAKRGRPHPPQSAKPPVRERTPSPSTPEPPPGPQADRTGVQTAGDRGSGSGPQSREPSQIDSPEPGRGQDEESADRAAAALVAWGLPADEAVGHVARLGPTGVSRCVVEARRLHEAGKLRSPVGFLRWTLSEADPRPVVPQPACEPVPKQRQASRAAAASCSQADKAIDALPDDELDDLVAAVLEQHADRPAMHRLLTAKPPRASRLMRAEVAALLGVT